MDDLTLLRELRRDDRTAPRALDGPRRALADAMGRAATGRTPRYGRRVAWIGGIGAIAVGVAATAFVVAPAVAPAPLATAEPPVAAKPSPTATATPLTTFPSASTVLVSAAENVTEPEDLAPGQYLRYEVSGRYVQYWDAEWSDDGDVNTIPGNQGWRDLAEGAAQIEQVRVLYVPADRNGDWVWDHLPDRTIATFGARVDDMLADMAADPVPTRTETERLVFPGGEQPGRDGEGLFALDSFRPYYDEMPRDPQQLLDWLRARAGGGPEADAWVVSSIDPLSTNLAPADLRAAIFGALALIDGLEVTAVDGDTTTITYRDGYNERLFHIVIDERSGTAVELGMTQDRSAAHIPDEVWDSAQSVRMSVVDDVPPAA